jgi:hypothetical protein
MLCLESSLRNLLPTVLPHIASHSSPPHHFHTWLIKIIKITRVRLALKLCARVSITDPSPNPSPPLPLPRSRSTPGMNDQMTQTHTSRMRHIPHQRYTNASHMRHMSHLARTAASACARQPRECRRGRGGPVRKQGTKGMMRK